MSNPLSMSERVVIREYFKNPSVSLKFIAEILQDERDDWDKSDKRIQNDVDVRSISKFKSIGLKKIRKGMKDLATSLGLDLTVQTTPKISGEGAKGVTRIQIYDLTPDDVKILEKWGGIIVGFDFRIDALAYLIYTVENGFVVWYEHNCTDQCETNCSDIFQLIQYERGFTDIKKRINLENFRFTIKEIAKKLKEGVTN
jgi:hypothetical protein